MPKITKMNNGLMFYDDFKEKSLMWTLSPSDANCLAFGEKGLRMLHQTRYCHYTMQEPAAEEYSCVVELDHIPFNEDDIAGILILSSNKEYAECQTYMATDSSEISNSYTPEGYIKGLVTQTMGDFVLWSENENNPNEGGILMDGSDDTIGDEWVKDKEDKDFEDIIYHFIKIHKVNNRYYFYASHDSYKWINVGNVSFKYGAQLGFFNYASKNKNLCQNLENSHVYFKDYAIYQSQYLSICGINRKNEFEIIDGSGRILVRSDQIDDEFILNRTNQETLINMTMLPTPILDAHVRVFLKDDYDTTLFEAEFGPKTYGGDKFVIDRDIRLYINSVEINDKTEYDLGVFAHNKHYIRVDIKNCDVYAMSNLIISVERYSEYYVGEKPIYIALHHDGTRAEDLKYEKKIIVGDLQPSESKSFFMRLQDVPEQGFYDVANAYKFKIKIE